MSAWPMAPNAASGRMDPVVPKGQAVTTTMTDATMKAIAYDTYGGPEVLEYKDWPRPTAEPGQVLVRVSATSINAADYRLMRADPFLARFGGGLRRPTKWPVLGSDFAGVVEAVGADVGHVEVGTEVFGDCFTDGRGAFAEYVSVAPDSLAPLPEGTSMIEAAAIPLAGITALQGVRDLAEVSAGDRVLIHGAGGGVGIMAVQIAKARGAEVTALCGPTSRPVVEQCGADRVIDYTVSDIADDEGGYDSIIAVNGYNPLATYKRLLGPGGRLVTIGGTGRTFLDAMVFARFAFMGSGKSASILDIDNEKRHTDLLELRRMIAEGELAVFVDRTYPLEQAADAMRYVEGGHVPGKVVLTIPS